MQLHARSNWFSTCAVQVNIVMAPVQVNIVMAPGAGLPPPTRDASCRIEAMPELYRLETMEGALQLPCRGRRCTDVNSHQPSGPVSRPDAAEGGPRVRPTLITVERCSHVRAMDSSTGDVQRRHYCNPQRLAPTLRFTGGAVHTGLIPVRDPSLGL
jgi:hypothetical protein